MLFLVLVIVPSSEFVNGQPGSFIEQNGDRVQNGD